MVGSAGSRSVSGTGPAVAVRRRPRNRGRLVGTAYVIVRYSSVYGEPQIIKQGSHSWVVAWFAARAALGMPLHLNGGGQQIRDLIHVDDIAEGTLRALTAP